MSASLTPMAMVRAPWRHRTLLFQLVRREILGRYRGSFLGIAWAVLHPLVLLAVYTFIFRVVFQARWGAEHATTEDFALMLFAGLVVFQLFAECFQRAPHLVLQNPNYVTKVVFPLEILPWVSLASAVFQAAIGFGVLTAATAILRPQALHWTALAVPVLLVPLCGVILGLSWFLAALGVYVRDLGPLVQLGTTVLMFLSPIFYPASALPERFRGLLALNPLLPSIEMVRDALLRGALPDPAVMLAWCAAGLLTAWAGFAWFQKTRTGFADVL